MSAICIWFIATSRPMELPSAWTEKLMNKVQRDRERLERFGTWLARLFGFERKQA